MRNRNGQPLTMEQLQNAAPSAFAGQAHESRSSRYTFVPTSEVVSALSQHGFLPIAATQSSSRIPGKELFTKHQIRFRSVNQIVKAVGDTFAELVMTNSHDGTSLYDFALGAFTLACLNGAVVSEGLVESVRIRHTGNILQAVIEGSESIIAQAPKLVECIQSWKSIELNNGEQRILAESAISLRYEGEAPTVEEVLKTRRYADNGSNLWNVYNRIQENIIRGGIRYLHTQRNPETNEFVSNRMVRTREVKGIDQSNKLNKELWTLAQKMADLKNGK